MELFELNEKEQHLHDMLYTQQPDFDSIRAYLDGHDLTDDEVTRAAIEYLDSCFIEESEKVFETDGDDLDEGIPVNRPAVLEDDLASAHAAEVLAMLLSYGLKPNAVYGEESLPANLMYIANEYVAADALEMLFENGLDVRGGTEDNQIFEDLHTDVCFDRETQMDRRRYDALVHCWMVYVGHGALCEDGRLPVTAFHPEFELDWLRAHREYFFGLGDGGNGAERGDWSLHIFDATTLWEVARL